MPTVKKFTKNLIKQFRPDVVNEIYQGSNKAYKKFVKHSNSVFSDIGEGICHAVAVQWIRHHRENNRDAFSYLLQKEIHSFGIIQQNISDEKAKYEQQQLAINGRYQNAREEINRILPLLAEEGRSLEEAERTHQEVLDVQEEINKTQNEQGILIDNINKMYATWVFANDEMELYRKIPNTEFYDLPTDFNALFPREDCYYYLSMQRNRDGGHGVAFYTGSNDLPPVFIDANSCEFEFNDLDHMYEFLSQYWLIYMPLYPNENNKLYEYER